MQNLRFMSILRQLNLSSSQTIRSFDLLLKKKKKKKKKIGERSDHVVSPIVR